MAILFSCHTQKSIIEERIPLCLWKELALSTLATDYDKLYNECAEYGQEVLDEYEIWHRNDRIEKEKLSRMFGMSSWSEMSSAMDLFNSLVGTPTHAA